MACRVRQTCPDHCRTGFVRLNRIAAANACLISRLCIADYAWPNFRMMEIGEELLQRGGALIETAPDLSGAACSPAGSRRVDDQERSETRSRSQSALRSLTRFALYTGER